MQGNLIIPLPFWEYLKVAPSSKVCGLVGGGLLYLTKNIKEISINLLSFSLMDGDSWFLGEFLIQDFFILLDHVRHWYALLACSWRSVLKLLDKRTCQKVFSISGKRYGTTGDSFNVFLTVFNIPFFISFVEYTIFRFSKRERLNYKEGVMLAASLRQVNLSFCFLSFPTGI